MKDIRTPPRPAVTPEMILEAAEELCKRERWDADQARDLADAYSRHMDGYELAKLLENDYGWDISVMDVEALDCMSSDVRRAHDKACAVWAQENNIQPPLPIGTMTTRGEIAGIYEHGPATYRVRAHGEMNPTRFLLIKFEDAIAVPEGVAS